MTSSGNRRSGRKLPVAAVAEIPGIVAPLADLNPIPAALAAPVKAPVAPPKPIVAKPVAKKVVAKPQSAPVEPVPVEPVPVEAAEAIVAPVAAITPPAPVVEQAIEDAVVVAGEVTATVEAETATIVEQVADTAETTASFVEATAETAAAPLHDLATATQTQQEKTIMDTMQTATDKTQAMFADANDRAKGAMEKGAKFFQEITEFGKGNVEAVVESSKIATKGFETMGQDTAAYLKTSFEDATQAFRTLATIKSPAELMKFQGDYLRTAFDAMVAQTSRGTEASLKLAGEVAQPISNRVAVAAEKIKIAA